MFLNGVSQGDAVVSGNGWTLDLGPGSEGTDYEVYAVATVTDSNDQDIDAATSATDSDSLPVAIVDADTMAEEQLETGATIVGATVVLSNDSGNAPVVTTDLSDAYVGVTLVGEVDYDSLGNYTLTLNQAGQDLVSALNSDQTLVITSSYTIEDADGDTDDALLSITVNGADDAFPAGLAYAVAGGFNAGNDQIDDITVPEAGTKYLYAVDLEDGTTTQVGVISTTTSNVTGLSLNPDDGNLYGISTEGISRIDPATAEAVLVLIDDTGLFGVSSPAGAAFGTDGTYYVASSGAVWSIDNIEDITIGTNFSAVSGSPLFDLGNGGGNTIHGIAVYDNGLIYYITESGGNSVLNVYDPTNVLGLGGGHHALGTVQDTVVNPDLSITVLSTPDLNGISFDNFGNLWGVDNQGDLVRIDSSSGEVLGVVTQDNSQVTAAGFFSIAIDVDAPLLVGTESDDVLGSTVGADVIDGLGGDDVIYGNGDDDTLSGGVGDDLVVGGSGNDVLSDGTGADILSGGDGSDIFIISADSDIDVIADFDATPDTDIDGTGTAIGADDVGTETDVLDLSDLLDGLVVNGTNQNDYIELLEVGNSVEVRVDDSGLGLFDGTAEVVLQNFYSLNPASTTSVDVTIDGTALNVDVS